MSKGDLFGPAFTVKDNLMIHKALQMAEPGDETNSITSEIMMHTAIYRILGGILIDGAIRDIAVLREMSIPIYATGVTSVGPYKESPGEINVPISIGIVVAWPGDILIGDDDGIVVVRPEDAPELIEKRKRSMLLKLRRSKRFKQGEAIICRLTKNLNLEGVNLLRVAISEKLLVLRKLVLVIWTIILG